MQIGITEIFCVVRHKIESIDKIDIFVPVSRFPDGFCDCVKRTERTAFAAVGTPDRSKRGNRRFGIVRGKPIEKCVAATFEIVKVSGSIPIVCTVGDGDKVRLEVRFVFDKLRPKQRAGDAFVYRVCVQPVSNARSIGARREYRVIALCNGIAILQELQFFCDRPEDGAVLY